MIEKKVAFCEEELITSVLLTDVKETDQTVIVDSGNPRTLGGRPKIEEYLEANDIRKEELISKPANMVFIFGDTRYTSKEVIEIPMKLELKGGESMMMNVPTYIVEGNVPILLGQNTLKRWNSKLNFLDETLEVFMYNEKKPLEFLAPKIGSHIKMKLEPLKKWSLEETVEYLEEEVHLISEEEKKK